MVQAPQPTTFILKSLCDRRLTVSRRPTAAFITLALLFAIAFASPAAMASVKEGAAVSVDSSTKELHVIDKLKPGLDIGLLVVIALLFALLGLFKDFRRYRGLLPVLFKSFYSWVFISFTATCIFFVDYLLYQWKLPHRYVPQEVVWHLSLALGHTGISAAFVYISPFLLSRIPTHARGTLEELSDEPVKEKPITEMNVVYAAIRDSLENEVNGRVLDWTKMYSWPVIKSTGMMLLTDMLNSGAISRQEFERAKLEEKGYEQCDDFCENRQRKYELLRKIMKHSSYQDLRSRLERTARAESIGTAS